MRRNVRENTRNCLRHQLWLLRVLKNNCASKLSIVFAPAHHFTGEMLFADIFACCEIAIHPANSSRPFLQTFRVSWSFESANVFSARIISAVAIRDKASAPHVDYWQPFIQSTYIANQQRNNCQTYDVLVLEPSSYIALSIHVCSSVMKEMSLNFYHKHQVCMACSGHHFLWRMLITRKNVAFCYTKKLTKCEAALPHHQNVCYL